MSFNRDRRTKGKAVDSHFCIIRKRNKFLYPEVTVLAMTVTVKLCEFSY